MEKEFSSIQFSNYQDLTNLEKEISQVISGDKKESHNDETSNEFETFDICETILKTTTLQNFANDNKKLNVFKIYNEIEKEKHFKFAEDFKEETTNSQLFLSHNPKKLTSDITRASGDEEDVSNGEKMENLVQYPPIFEATDLEHAGHYNDKLMHMLDDIRRFEDDIREKMISLEDEKLERLQIQEEMCSQISNDHLNDNNALLFLNLCKSERNLIRSNEEKIDKNIEQSKCKIGKKNFIHRNIELATKAMSKLPLTDEEKRQLDTILADIDADENAQNDRKAQETEADVDDDNVISENAFHLSKADEQRICDIDLELEQNFSETKSLRSSSYDEANFWKNLILEQSLKQIDEKLAVLKSEDGVD